jgi:parvulin-like peptidyl-prolyl isomerase
MSDSRRPLILLALGALAGAALAAAGLRGAAGGGALPEGVVAVVNGEPIAEQDYLRMIAAVGGERRAPLDAEDRRRILDRLIDEELLVQRGLALGLARTDRRVRADLTATVIDAVVSETGESEPSETEVAAFYDAHRDFFAGPGRLRLRQVFVRVTRPNDAEALARAEQAAARLRAGESLESVDAALGDAALAPLPDTALPPAKLRDYLGPTALRTALELDVGAVSDPVRSGTGYHVLQVVERQPDSAPPLADIRPQVVAEMRRRGGEAALRAYLDELRAGADVTTAERLP